MCIATCTCTYHAATNVILLRYVRMYVPVALNTGGLEVICTLRAMVMNFFFTTFLRKYIFNVQHEFCRLLLHKLW